MVRHKNSEELRKLAADTVLDKIFSSTMIDDTEDPRILNKIFLPLLVLNEQQVKDVQAYDPVMFYEYLDKATEHKVKGYPVFYSVRMLDVLEFDEYSNAVWQCEKAIREAARAWGGEDN